MLSLSEVVAGVVVMAVVCRGLVVVMAVCRVRERAVHVLKSF